MHWDDILREVLDKNKNKQKFKTDKAPQTKIVKAAVNQKKPTRMGKGMKKNYFLIDDGKKICFTRREAQCVVTMLRGESAIEIARALGLSTRTVDFYLKNAKKKLGCRRRAEMLAKVAATGFADNIKF